MSFIQQSQFWIETENNIDLRQKGVQILVVGPKGKTIVNFGVKEGEKKAISGKVSFATVEPVDLASYPTFEEI